MLHFFKVYLTILGRYPWKGSTEKDDLGKRLKFLLIFNQKEWMGVFLTKGRDELRDHRL